ncbi:MAG: methionyl-tRNA formyltransferase [Anaerolineaceae bacterium]|nr:methionyl-tRNA formyltransferase [Anaerolineaceae bacterium]
MGTPDFAVPSLTALIDSDYDVAAVVTQPDRPSGRGKRLTPPPVKAAAEAADLKVLQPRTLKSPEAFAALAAFKPDLIIVAAFGQILRSNVLDLPPYGCINVHASLLPRWRGAAPITAAVLAGDAETGVTIMKMDEGLDTGPMIAKRAIPITDHHTGGMLTAILADLGAQLLIDTLPHWVSGEIEPQPQDNSQATFAPRLDKQAGALDWSQPAVAIERKVRAFDPWPGTFTTISKGPVKILNVSIAREVTPPPDSPPGAVFKQRREVYITTGDGVLQLITVQPAGKKAMPAEAWLNGQPDLEGSRLGS